MKGEWVEPARRPPRRERHPAHAASPSTAPHWRWLAVIAVAGACVAAIAVQAGVLRDDPPPPEQEVPWRSVDVAEDDASIFVTYEVPDCAAPSRVKADIRESTVEVTVSVVPGPCTGGSVLTARMRLTEDLDGRQIVDGARR